MKNKQFKIGSIILIIYLLFVIVFFTLALQSAPDSTKSSSVITDLVMIILKGISFNKWNLDYDVVHNITRKLIGHFSYCIVMGILLGWWSELLIKPNKLGKYRLVIIIVISAFVSILSEVLQLIPDGRAFSTIDIVIDFCGHIFGIIIIIIIVFLNNKKKQKQNV